MILYTGYVTAILMKEAPHPHTNSCKSMCQNPCCTICLLFSTISSRASYPHERNKYYQNIIPKINDRNEQRHLFKQTKKAKMILRNKTLTIATVYVINVTHTHCTVSHFRLHYIIIIKQYHQHFLKILREIIIN